MTKFSWTVLSENFNWNSIEEYDVLQGREKEIKKLRKKYKDNKEEFIKQLKLNLKSQYRSRCEYELYIYKDDEQIYLRTLFPVLRSNVIEVKDTDSFKWSEFFETLDYKGKDVKIDIWDQIEFRWDEFVDYCWNYKFEEEKKTHMKKCYFGKEGKGCCFYVKGALCNEPSNRYGLYCGGRKQLVDGKFEFIDKEINQKKDEVPVKEDKKSNSDFDSKIAELKKEFEDKLEELREEYKNSYKKNKEEWKIGDIYFYLDCHGDVKNNSFSNRVYEEWLVKIGNIFRTEEEANFKREKILVEYELKKFVEENDPNPITEKDWSNKNLAKAFLVYRYNCNRIDYECDFEDRKADQVYASNAEVLKKAIEAIGEEQLKKYYFGVDK